MTTTYSGEERLAIDLIASEDDLIEDLLAVTKEIIIVILVMYFPVGVKLKFIILTRIEHKTNI